MRYLIIADIHSNPYPLYKCLEIEKNNFDEIILLGDYISDCPYPDRVMDFVHQLTSSYRCHCIKGNREQYQLDYRHSEIKFFDKTSSTGSLFYTYNNLKDEDLCFFESLSKNKIIDCPGFGNIEICHGSPDSLFELLYPNQDNTDCVLQKLDSKILICAHSHVQFIYRKYDKTLINPGSIGIPFQSNGFPQYCILNISKDSFDVEMKKLEYDKTLIIEDIKDSGLLEKAPIYTRLIMKEIMEGCDYMPQTLNLAKELAKEANVLYDKHGVPERFWEKAFAIMFPDDRL